MSSRHRALSLRIYFRPSKKFQHKAQSKPWHINYIKLYGVWQMLLFKATSKGIPWELNPCSNSWATFAEMSRLWINHQKMEQCQDPVFLKSINTDNTILQHQGPSDVHPNLLDVRVHLVGVGLKQWSRAAVFKLLSA